MSSRQGFRSRSASSCVIKLKNTGSDCVTNRNGDYTVNIYVDVGSDFNNTCNQQRSDRGFNVDYTGNGNRATRYYQVSRTYADGSNRAASATTTGRVKATKSVNFQTGTNDEITATRLKGESCRPEERTVRDWLVGVEVSGSKIECHFSVQIKRGRRKTLLVSTGDWCHRCKEYTSNRWLRSTTWCCPGISQCPEQRVVLKH